ncbi:hypothetical protein MFMK1_001124 [Metallumcola ferriviriculae]|uniref:Uncharacterized protein n=1 Tax=Metallumcola ferriviriculae TaxID=3039180 RepID=A0AAU0UM99_9FIRM|nr:hypothetical protein MFMK1_001124 [Desulfitibacteraceae bacterium MK1]
MKETEVRHEHQIKPGPCHHHGCPPPNEIVCIKTKKVYQECKQTEVFELKVYEWDKFNRSCDFSSPMVVPEGAAEIINCSIVPKFFSFDKCDKAAKPDKNSLPCNEPCDTPCYPPPQNESCCEVGKGRIKFTLWNDIDIPVFLEFDNGSTRRGCVRIKAPVSKTVTMPRAGTHPMFQCEVDLWITRCLLCFIEESNAADYSNSLEIHCCINVIMAFKLFAEVQLLIPAYGFCVPPECKEINGKCPPGEEEWPPYPPQEVDNC